MNQILCTSNSSLETVNRNYRKKNLYSLLFIFSIIIAVFLAIYYLIFKYNLYSSEKISKKLLDSFSITRSLF